MSRARAGRSLPSTKSRVRNADRCSGNDVRGSGARPRRKHPWLLALAVLLLVGWLAFLAFMAFGL